MTTKFSRSVRGQAQRPSRQQDQTNEHLLGERVRSVHKASPSARHGGRSTVALARFAISRDDLVAGLPRARAPTKPAPRLEECDLGQAQDDQAKASPPGPLFRRPDLQPGPGQKARLTEARPSQSVNRPLAVFPSHQLNMINDGTKVCRLGHQSGPARRVRRPTIGRRPVDQFSRATMETVQDREGTRSSRRRVHHHGNDRRPRRLPDCCRPVRRGGNKQAAVTRPARRGRRRQDGIVGSAAAGPSPGPTPTPTQRGRRRHEAEPLAGNVSGRDRRPRAAADQAGRLSARRRRLTVGMVPEPDPARRTSPTASIELFGQPIAEARVDGVAATGTFAGPTSSNPVRRSRSSIRAVVAAGGTGLRFDASPLAILAEEDSSVDANVGKEHARRPYQPPPAATTAATRAAVHSGTS